jgi:hypothetical protein
MKKIAYFEDHGSFFNRNLLTGNLPHFTFPYLTHLWADNNQLSGNIPPFAYDSLKTLHLYNNQLQGCIPAIIKTRCAKLGTAGGNISGNPNLATQSWENYWNLNEGTCRTSTSDLKETHLTILPNPTNNWFTIRYDVMPNEILVYNSLGRLLQNITPAPEQVQIDMSAYSTGCCTLRIVARFFKTRWTIGRRRKSGATIESIRRTFCANVGKMCKIRFT